MIVILALLAIDTTMPSETSRTDRVATQFVCNLQTKSGSKLLFAATVTADQNPPNPESEANGEIMITRDDSKLFKGAAIVPDASTYKDGSVDLQVAHKRDSLLPAELRPVLWVRLPAKGPGHGEINLEPGYLGHAQRENLSEYVVPKTEATGFCSIVGQKTVSATR